MLSTFPESLESTEPAWVLWQGDEIVAGTQFRRRSRPGYNVYDNEIVPCVIASGPIALPWKRRFVAILEKDIAVRSRNCVTRPVIE